MICSFEQENHKGVSSIDVLGFMVIWFFCYCHNNNGSDTKISIVVFVVAWLPQGLSQKYFETTEVHVWHTAQICYVFFRTHEDVCVCMYYNRQHSRVLHFSNNVNNENVVCFGDIYWFSVNSRNHDSRVIGTLKYLRQTRIIAQF